MKPLCIDLFCGLGGWTEGFLAEGYDVIGFDIERRLYPAQLVLQDVLTLHGSQFRDAAVIVASPPCQAYSYRAMPWKRAKALPPPDNSLFEVCFRIQREASGSAGRHIPLVVENVKGAQPWVGRAKWHFGSFYLWGDVPALMPFTRSAKIAGQNWNRYKENGEVSPHWRMEARVLHKVKAGLYESRDGNWRAWRNDDPTHERFGVWSLYNFKHSDESIGDHYPTLEHCEHVAYRSEIGTKNNGGSWFAVAHNTESGHGQNPVNGQKVPVYSDPRRNGGKGAHLTSPRENQDGLKQGGDWFGPGEDSSISRRCGSGSPARKAASAQIAKIPFPLAQWIARVYKP